jgi:hypoxanthine phosphoribosyltransferase
MTGKSYDYKNREGTKHISWEEFGELSLGLANKIAKYEPHIIIGIARAGLIPATAVACSLRLEMFPVRVTRRINDQIAYKRPVWKVPVTKDVKGKIVAVVDEIADTGETLKMVTDEVINEGAFKVISACLVSHTWAIPVPDITELVSDALIIFPWDNKVLINGVWKPHPEITAAIIAQMGNQDQV